MVESAAAERRPVTVSHGVVNIVLDNDRTFVKSMLVCTARSRFVHV